jgi:hypothetical protein
LEEAKNAYKILIGKPERKEIRHRRNDDIKMNLLEV